MAAVALCVSRRRLTTKILCSLGPKQTNPLQFLNESVVHLAAIQHNQQQFGRRHLFSSEILGLENYARQKSSLKEKTGALREKFFSRMEDYMKSSEKSTVFTDDVKTMVYFTETEEELETGVKMLKRFHLQNKDLRFSNFIFGPLVLRLLYTLKKPDLAFQLFTDKNMFGMFDQMSSFIILMDLLYESGQYNRVLEVMEIVKERQLNGIKYPMDCVTLAIAACYKINSANSLETVITLLRDIKGATVSISLRSSVYAAMLAYKQGKSDVALEFLSTTSIRPNRSMPVAYINVKLLILSALNRCDETVDYLKAFVQQDVPDQVTQGQEVFEEVLNKVREVVNKSGSKELKHQLDITEKALKDSGHVATGQSFEEYLQRPILRQRRLQDGFKQRPRAPIDGFKRLPGKQSYHPGLLE